MEDNTNFFRGEYWYYFFTFTKKICPQKYFARYFVQQILSSTVAYDSLLPPTPLLDVIASVHRENIRSQ